MEATVRKWLLVVVVVLVTVAFPTAVIATHEWSIQGDNGIWINVNLYSGLPWENVSPTGTQFGTRLDDAGEFTPSGVWTNLDTRTIRTSQTSLWGPFTGFQIWREVHSPLDAGLQGVDAVRVITFLRNVDAGFRTIQYASNPCEQPTITYACNTVSGTLPSQYADNVYWTRFVASGNAAGATGIAPTAGMHWFSTRHVYRSATSVDFTYPFIGEVLAGPDAGVSISAAYGAVWYPWGAGAVFDGGEIADAAVPWALNALDAGYHPHRNVVTVDYAPSFSMNSGDTIAIMQFYAKRPADGGEPDDAGEAAMTAALIKLAASPPIGGLSKQTRAWIRNFVLCTGADSDGDGVPDECDNCPLIANANQFDSDSNGFGDACGLNPTCAFGTATVYEGQEVSVVATQPGSGLSATWSFGDGTTSDAGLAVTHTFGDNGNFVVTVTVSHPEAGTGTCTLVQPVLNVPPTIATSSSAATAIVGQLWTHAITFSDQGPADVNAGFTVNSTMGGMTWSSDAGRLTWTPAAVQLTRNPVTAQVSVCDKDQGCGSVTLAIPVVGANAALNEGPDASPTLIGPSGSVVATRTPTFTFTNVADPNGDVVSYALQIAKDSSFDAGVVTLSGIAQTQPTTSTTLSFLLDDNAIYAWRVRASDGTQNGPWSASASFTVNASGDTPTAPVLVYPVHGGSVAESSPTFRVWNSTDLDPGEMRVYDFALYGAGGATLVASASGVAEGSPGTTWTTAWVLVADAGYEIRVRARDTGGLASAWASAAFVLRPSNSGPTAATAVSPANGALVPASSVELVASGAVDPDGDGVLYFFQLADSPTFASGLMEPAPVLADTDGGVGRATVAGLVENRVYWWRVMATDGRDAGSGWSAARSFHVSVVTDIPPAPTSVSPISGATVTTTRPTFVVANSNDPNGGNLTYTFEVYSDSTLATLVTSASGVPQGNEELSDAGKTAWTPDAGLTDNNAYAWRAFAVTETAVKSASSATATFKVNVANDPPPAPSLFYPTSNEAVTAAQPTLSVLNATDPDGDALTYDFEVYRDTALSDLAASATGVASGTSGVTTWTVSLALATRSYAWRARARDASGPGAWSTASTFSVASGAASRSGCGVAPSRSAEDAPWTVVLLGVVAFGILKRRRENIAPRVADQDCPIASSRPVGPRPPPHRGTS